MQRIFPVAVDVAVYLVRICGFVKFMNDAFFFTIFDYTSLLHNYEHRSIWHLTTRCRTFCYRLHIACCRFYTLLSATFFFSFCSLLLQPVLLRYCTVLLTDDVATYQYTHSLILTYNNEWRRIWIDLQHSVVWKFYFFSRSFHSEKSVFFYLWCCFRFRSHSYSLALFPIEYFHIRFSFAKPRFHIVFMFMFSIVDTDFDVDALWQYSMFNTISQEKFFIRKQCICSFYYKFFTIQYWLSYEKSKHSHLIGFQFVFNWSQTNNCLVGLHFRVKSTYQNTRIDPNNRN